MIRSNKLPGPTAFVADPHPIMRFALARVLRTQLGFSEVVESARFDAKRVAAAQPSLLIVAATLRGACEKSTLSRWRASAGAARIVLIGDAGELLGQNFAQEVDLVLDKSMSEDMIVAALRETAIAGAPSIRRSPGAPDDGHAAPVRKLRAREVQILKMLGDGLRNRQIASALGISEPTVKHYVSCVFSAFQVSNRTQAALKANAHAQQFP